MKWLGRTGSFRRTEVTMLARDLKSGDARYCGESIGWETVRRAVPDADGFVLVEYRTGWRHELLADTKVVVRR